VPPIVGAITFGCPLLSLRGAVLRCNVRFWPKAGLCDSISDLLLLREVGPRSNSISTATNRTIKSAIRGSCNPPSTEKPQRGVKQHAQ